MWNGRITKKGSSWLFSPNFLYFLNTSGCLVGLLTCSLLIPTGVKANLAERFQTIVSQYILVCDIPVWPSLITNLRPLSSVCDHSGYCLCAPDNNWLPNSVSLLESQTFCGRSRESLDKSGYNSVNFYYKNTVYQTDDTSIEIMSL